MASLTRSKAKKGAKALAVAAPAASAPTDPLEKFRSQVASLTLEASDVVTLLKEVHRAAKKDGLHSTH